MQIFLDDTDYRHFLYLLGEIVDEFQVECWDYCAIWNHYHLTLRPGKPNFSDAMRHLNGEYAQWWNRRHDRVGHAFQGRPKAQIVEGGDYLLTLCRYIAMNPVRAHLVDRPEDWRWSSYAAIAGLARAPAFLAVESTLRLFGHADTETLRARYAAHVNGPGDLAIMDRIRSNEQILGDRAFKQRIREHASDAAQGSNPGLTLV